MMLIGVADTGILAELLIGLVIGVDEILSSILNPALGGLDAKMVIPLSGQFTLATGTFQDALCKCH